MNFDKSTVELHFFFLISSMFAKFPKDKKLIAMLLTNVKISSFCSSKLCVKNNFIDQIVNKIRFAQNFTCVLRT